MSLSSRSLFQYFLSNVTRTKKSVSNYRVVSVARGVHRKLTITADGPRPNYTNFLVKVAALVIGSAIDCRDASGSIEIGLKSHYPPILGKTR